MSLWGDSDLLVVPGFVDGTTVTITATNDEYWTAVGAGITNAPLGSAATFGALATAQGRAGFGIVLAVEAVDTLRITPGSSLTGAHECVFSTSPKYLTNSPAYNPAALPTSPQDGRVTRVGVVTAGDVTDEVNTVWKASTGWVGVTNYVQTDPDGTETFRVKTEVLVAGSSYEGSEFRPYPEAFDAGS